MSPGQRVEVESSGVIDASVSDFKVVLQLRGTAGW
jgi:hypothetical protein